MNEPKTIYANLKRCDITFIPLDGSQAKYTSVNKLKEWIEENETELRELYELRKYLEEK